VEIKLSNNYSHIITKKDDIKDIKNVKKKSIKELTISFGYFGRIHFNEDECSISATSKTEASLTKLVDDIKDIFSGTKPWYSFLSYLAYNIIIIITMLLSSILLMVTMKRMMDDTKEEEFTDAFVEITIGIFIVFIAIAIAFSRIFPKAEFAIGHGLARYDRKREIVNWAVGAVIVAVISSIF